MSSPPCVSNVVIVKNRNSLCLKSDFRRWQRFWHCEGDYSTTSQFQGLWYDHGSIAPYFLIHLPSPAHQLPTSCFLKNLWHQPIASFRNAAHNASQGSVTHSVKRYLPTWAYRCLILARVTVIGSRESNASFAFGSMAMVVASTGFMISQ